MERLGTATAGKLVLPPGATTAAFSHNGVKRGWPGDHFEAPGPGEKQS